MSGVLPSPTIVLGFRGKASDRLTRAVTLKGEALDSSS